VRLSDAQVELYSRQIILRELGGVGQRRLLEARLLVLGEGAAYETALTYLAGAGVGTLVALGPAPGEEPTRLPFAPLATRNPDCRLHPTAAAAPPLDSPRDGYDVVLSLADAGLGPPAPPTPAPRLGTIAVRARGGAVEIALLPRGAGCLACLVGRDDASSPASPGVAQLAAAGALAALACCRWLADLASDEAPRALRLDPDGTTWHEAIPERRAICPHGCPAPVEPV
jgi:adenylyltransferase/sulfurtransferase